MLDSRFGKILIIAFTVFTIVVYGAAFWCGLDTCAHYIVLPILPWAYIIAEDFGLTFPWAVYPIMVLLNISVVYAVGVGLEWLYHTYKDRKG